MEAYINENKQLIDNVKEFRILTEWVNRNDVVDAIKNADIVYIYYAGDETVNRGYRTVEPYALGRSTAGNLVLRAWQQAGSSDSKGTAKRENDEVPGWRLFRLDGITTFMKTFKKFDPKNPRPKYNPNDKGMSEIIISVDPTKDVDVKVAGTDSIDEPDVTQQKLSAFDTQAAKFKDFYSAAKNKETVTKKAIGDLYELVKYHYKKDPSNFIVVNKNGKYWVDKKINQSKYEPNMVYGQLNDLYRKFMGVEQGHKVSRQFIDKQKQDFLKALQKEVGI